MNNEHIERKMKFIVEQQAQFAVDIQKLQESQAQTEKAVVQLTENVAKTVEGLSHVGDFVIRLANYTHNRVDEFDVKMNALIQAQIRNEKSIERLGEKVAETSESLKNFIAENDRDRRERRNGK